MAEQHVKELAYTIDPGCWKSYLGQSKLFKQAMDARRDASIRLAEKRIAENPELQPAREPELHLSNAEIADALLNADWSDTSTGNKLLILAAAKALA